MQIKENKIIISMKYKLTQLLLLQMQQNIMQGLQENIHGIYRLTLKALYN